MGKVMLVVGLATIGLAWGIGSSGLPGPWLAQWMEHWIGGGWAT